MFFSPVLFSGCNAEDSSIGVYVVSIEQTTSNNEGTYYLVTYSNGQTTTLSIQNGVDGQDGQDGRDGENGRDGQDLTIGSVYAKYVEEYGEISYADFLREYLNVTFFDNSTVINSCLSSCLKVYTEFYTTAFVGYDRWFNPQYADTVSMMCGSAIVYKVESDYTYVLTNYHVVFNANANTDNGSNIARKIVGYLYGSEDDPVDSGTKENGYTVYNYGTYGLEFEYVGGSIDYDIAVLKIETNRIKAVNEDVKAVELAEKYYVGETAIAIGNPENEGISVTQGIVSVDNEYISLSIDNQNRSYRSIRIDTSIYGGSSGGGLFNCYGQLIGITNAGDNNDQNINYAIPVEIVKGVAKNILDYYDGTSPTSVKKIKLGISASSQNSKYVYDSASGYGSIVEDIIVDAVEENSIASILGLQENDQIKSIFINDIEYSINRTFEIGDILLGARGNDVIKVIYTRNSQQYLSTTYTILDTDIQ